MTVFPQDFTARAKDESEIFSVDWSNVIPNDTISTATWLSRSGTLTFSNQSLSSGDQEANVTISAGTSDTKDCVICRIVTVTSGETMEERIPLRVLPDAT